MAQQLIFRGTDGQVLTCQEAEHMVIRYVSIDDETETITVDVVPVTE